MLEEEFGSIKSLYKELSGLKDLRPSPKVNKLFVQLVKYVLNSTNKDTSELSSAEIAAMQKMCQKAEFELEMYWAKHALQNPDVNLEIKNFPYYDNYIKLTELEWSLLTTCTEHQVHNICFVGGGPLPLTAILLANKPSIHTVTILEKDRTAVNVSKTIVRKLGLENKITLEQVDASKYDKYLNFNVVMVAALAGVEKSMKSEIMKKIKLNTKKQTHILARSSWGMRELLYQPLDQRISNLFHPIMEVKPSNDIINSVVIFKNI